MPATNTKRQLKSDDSAAAKKRKVEGDLKNNRLAKLSQNLPKSSFEEELGNLSQEISDLKGGNAETDQKWARPDLDPSFDPQTENLLFQQIDVEEGTLDGKTTIQLFGVTEVSIRRSSLQIG
jgi:DNA polymerase delta subunit 1